MMQVYGTRNVPCWYCQPPKHRRYNRTGCSACGNTGVRSIPVYAILDAEYDKDVPGTDLVPINTPL